VNDYDSCELEPALNWTCGYSPGGVLECLDEATWHGFRLTDTGTHIESMMASCDTHEPRMAACADYVHAMASPCGVAGSRFRWPENECYVEWGDEAAFMAAAVTAAAA
jgi:hypothetical protein